MLLPAMKYRYFKCCEDGTFASTDRLKPNAELNYLVCTPSSVTAVRRDQIFGHA
jgi:hypothetical protein